MFMMYVWAIACCSVSPRGDIRKPKTAESITIIEQSNYGYIREEHIAWYSWYIVGTRQSFYFSRCQEAALRRGLCVTIYYKGVLIIDTLT